MRKLKAWFKPYEWYRKEYEKANNITWYVLLVSILVLMIYGLAIATSFEEAKVPMLYFVLIMGIGYGIIATLKLVDQHENKINQGKYDKLIAGFVKKPMSESAKKEFERITRKVCNEIGIDYDEVIK